MPQFDGHDRSEGSEKDPSQLTSARLPMFREFESRLRSCQSKFRQHWFEKKDGHEDCEHYRKDRVSDLSADARFWDEMPKAIALYAIMR